MATIAEAKESMTIYYSKSTGIIRNVMGGVQDMSIYGELQSDMEMIQGFLVLPRNDDIMKNSTNYKVNTDTLQLIKVVDSESDIKIKALEEDNINIKLAMAELIEMMGGV